jgi:hypothetical protein
LGDMMGNADGHDASNTSHGPKINTLFPLTQVHN